MHIELGNRSERSWSPVSAVSRDRSASDEISLDTGTGLGRCLAPGANQRSVADSGFTTGITTLNSAFIRLPVMRAIASGTFLALAADSFLRLNKPGMGVFELLLAAAWGCLAYCSRGEGLMQKDPEAKKDRERIIDI